MTDNERVRRSISATLSEIEQAPWQWQQLGDVIEALEIIQRIERRLNNRLPSHYQTERTHKLMCDDQADSNDYWQGVRWPT
jgi:hypothetical protein